MYKTHKACRAQNPTYTLLRIMRRRMSYKENNRWLDGQDAAANIRLKSYSDLKKGVRAMRTNKLKICALRLMLWIICCVMGGVAMNAQAQTVLFEEDFEGLPLQDSFSSSEVIRSEVWTDVPPTGWTIDNSQMCNVGGVPEFHGWVFLDLTWWQDTAGQERDQFDSERTAGAPGFGIAAVADGDEWHDLSDGCDEPAFHSWMSTPSINTSGYTNLTVSFDSTWRQEVTQEASLEVSYDGGEPVQLFHWNCESGSPDFHDTNYQEHIDIPLNDADSVVLTFGYYNADNDWWWAIDNVKVTGALKAFDIDPLNFSGNEDDPITASYMISALAAPDPNVRVVVTPSDLGTGDPCSVKLNAAGWGEPVSLHFTAANWQTPQMVNFTIKDDEFWNRWGVYDDNTYTVIIKHTAKSSDPDFNNAFMDNVIITVADDEFPEMETTVTNDWTHVVEGGATDSYTVALTGGEPNSFPVTVQVVPDNAEVKLNGGAAGATLTLTFSSGDWATPQTVTIEADQDGDVEGDHTTVLSHVVSGGFYNNYPLSDITVYISDDDDGVTLNTDLVLHLRLDNDLADYSGRDNNPIVVGNPTDVSGLIGGSAYFLNEDDHLVLDQSDFLFGTLTDFTVSMWVKSNGDTSDPTYISNKDWNASANVGWGIFRNGNSLRCNYTANEGTNTSHYPGVNVEDDQWHHVLVTYDRNGDSVAYIDGAPRSSTSIATGNSIDTGLPTVIGQDGTQTYGEDMDFACDDVCIWRRLLGPTEIRQLSLDMEDVPNGPGIGLDPNGIPFTVEEGSDNNYTVVLYTQPTQNVTITVDPDPDIVDLGNGVGINKDLIFTPSNWDTPQLVTVSAPDDSVFFGNRTVTLSHHAESDDMTYDGRIRSLDVVILDDDVPTVTVNPTALAIPEGGSDTYTIVLDADPGAEVKITIDPDGAPESKGMQIDLGAGLNVPIELTFTSGDWFTPQTVTVNVAEDTILEGDRNARLVHTPESTGNYGMAVIDDVIVTVLENECGHWGYPPMDFDRNCQVDLLDLSRFLAEWLDCTQPFESGCVNLSP